MCVCACACACVCVCVCVYGERVCIWWSVHGEREGVYMGRVCMDEEREDGVYGSIVNVFYSS